MKRLLKLKFQQSRKMTNNNEREVISIDDEELQDEELKQAIRRSEIETQNEEYEKARLEDIIRESEKEFLKEQERQKLEEERQQRLAEEEKERKRQEKCDKVLNAIQKTNQFDRECTDNKGTVSIRLRFQTTGATVERRFSKDDFGTVVLQWAALENRNHNQKNVCLPNQIVLRSPPPLGFCISGRNFLDKNKTLREMNLSPTILFHFTQ